MRRDFIKALNACFFLLVASCLVGVQLSGCFHNETGEVEIEVDKVTLLDKLEQLDRMLPKIDKQKKRGEDLSTEEISKFLKDGQAVLISREALREIISELRKKLDRGITGWQ